jgi:uncharacterized phage protein (TIGR02218 family)
MRATPAPLLAHMAAGETTLCHLIKVTRTDAVVYAITDHDQDLVYGAVTYKASLGMDASAIETSATLAVDNLEARGFLATLGITEASIASGVWDYADVRVYRVNWNDLAQGDEKLLRGWIGNISIARPQVTAEVRSLAQKLQNRIGEYVTESCKADLFDARCKVVATEGAWKFSGVAVSTIVAAQRQFTASALTQAAAFFTAGKVVWQTGANAGLQMEIKAHATGGDLLLQEPMPYAIAVADTFTVYAGCTKRYVEDCRTKFVNTDNFRGFPFVPGEDAVLRGPQ